MDIWGIIKLKKNRRVVNDYNGHGVDSAFQCVCSL